MAYPQSRHVVGVVKIKQLLGLRFWGLLGGAGKSNWATVSEESYCSC